METVIVERTNNARYFRASINDVRLVFDASGRAKKKLRPGKCRLTWSVLGQQGDKYTIRVTAPDYVICRGGGTLDAEGIDFGRCRFEIR